MAFDVERYVEDYEFRSDEGDYTPDENEKGMLTDAIHGALAEVCDDRQGLLEALGKIERYVLDTKYPSPSTVAQYARAAIAKATGADQ